MSLLLPAAQATSVYVHNGATDPVTEGWTAYVGSGGGTTAAAVYNDFGSGLDAWAVDDNSTAFDTGRYYYEDLTTAQVSEGSTAGWRLSVRLRIVNIPDGFTTVTGFGWASTISAFYRDGAKDWYLGFGTQADGDPVIRLPNNTSGTWAFEGGGSGYHLYELVYDPVALSADFFIDGVERVSNIVASNSNTTKRVSWGAMTSPDAGEGRFNYVRFATSNAPSIVPVPPAAMLLMSGLITLGGLRRRGRVR